VPHRLATTPHRLVTTGGIRTALKATDTKATEFRLEFPLEFRRTPFALAYLLTHNPTCPPACTGWDLIQASAGQASAGREIGEPTSRCGLLAQPRPNENPSCCGVESAEQSI
jgi:hypothetical protein